MNRDLLAAAFVAGAALAPRLWILFATSASGLMADMVDYFDRARYLFEHGRLYRTRSASPPIRSRFPARSTSSDRRCSRRVCCSP